MIRLRCVAIFLMLAFAPVAFGASATGSNGSDVSIPDGTGSYRHSPITISSAPSGARVTRIDWSFSIVHSYGGDLDVDLNDNSRSTAFVANLWTGTQNGGTDSGVNPSRSGTITSGSLIGLPVNQTWYLAAADVAAGDTGYINSWTITVYWADAPAETVSVPTGLSGEPNPVQNVASTYSVNASTSSSGHTIEYSFTWGDGTSSPYSTSTSAYHAWSSTGQKYVYVTARCQTHTTITANNAPGSYVTVQPATETVSVPTGLSGEPNPVQNVASTYSVNASTSSSGHPVEYSFTWGDGTSSPYSSSTSAAHAWSSTGQKYVYVTARCQTHTTITANNAPGSYATVQPVVDPPVTLTLYVHSGSASGPLLSDAQVTGTDGAGHSFSQTTGAGGSVVITGARGTWSFAASKSGYNAVSWNQSTTATITRDAFLTVIPGQILSVTPASPPTQSASAGSIYLSVTITGGGTMRYAANVTSVSPWLTITSGGSGGNSGTINVSYALNSGAQRSGTIQVTASGASGSPVTVTLTQAGASGGFTVPITQDFIPAGRNNRPAYPLTVNYITIHDTDNTSVGANAVMHSSYVKGGTAAALPVSWHFTVDDHEIYQHLPVDENGWHAADGNGPGNRQSIAIEICMNSDGNRAQAEDNAAWLTAKLLTDHSLTLAQIKQHNNWSGKNCPSVLRGRVGGWDGFLARVAFYKDGGSTTVAVTLVSSPSGLLVSVDGGTAVPTPVTLNWTAGSSHTVSTPTPQYSGDSHTRYTFSSWSDSGAQSHTITTPGSATTYTASFSTQYMLDTTPSPLASGTFTLNPAGPWYNPGQTVSLTAIAGGSYTFSSWSGVDSFSGNTASITMNSYRNVTASFTATPNLPPTVSLGASPLMANTGDPVVLTATAADPDGVVTRVEFFDGATKLGEDLSSPYSFTVSSLTVGMHSLTAKATDNVGGTTTSTAVSVTVTSPANVPPTVTLGASPTTADQGATVTLTATATDSDGTVAKVEFFDGATKLGEDLTSPYSFTVSTLTVGIHSLTAKATDNLGAVTTSTAVSVTVNPPPSGLTAGHSSVGYVVGGTAALHVRIDYTGTLTSLGYEVVLPAGWSYASDTSTAGVKPAPGDQGTIALAWTSIPVSPVEFDLVVNVAAGTTGEQTISAQVSIRQGGPEFRADATPNPLRLNAYLPYHSADTTQDWKFSLTELTRVISLYNYRVNSIRTGELHAETGTEDGYAAGPGAQTSRGHSADTSGNWMFSLTELTRVISLYNYRDGSIRTGDYQRQAGSEDGYAPGPAVVGQSQGAAGVAGGATRFRVPMSLETAALTASSQVYVAGQTLTVALQVTYQGTLTAYGWELDLPAGWSYVSDTSTSGVTPVANQQGTLEWAWTGNFPTSPTSFNVVVQVPINTSGNRTLAARAILRDPLRTLIATAITISDTVPPALSILTQPRDQTVVVGSNVTFSVSATGRPPLTYQWRREGTNLPGATSSSLLLDNVTLNQGGIYTVVVTDAAGDLPSAPARLLVTTSLFQPPALQSAATIRSQGFGLTLLLEAGRSFRVQGTTDLVNPMWTDVTNFVSTGAAFQFIDAAASSQTRRFYRVVSP